MIKYSGMEAKESGNGGNSQLPAGAYVAKVIGARIVGLEPDQQLEIMLDIVWPEQYKDFYMNKFTAQKQRGSNYEIRYKGIMKVRIPNPDNKKAMYPESDLKRFNDMIAKFQNSNSGVSLFSEDGFDESKLAELLIGVSVQEDEYNGNKFTKPVRFENVEAVRNGAVNIMPPKRSDGINPTTAPMVDQRSGMTRVDTTPLPWDEKPY
jgi:hypothetical protein